MTRGNQREMARAKAAKKAGDSSKGKPKDGLSVAQRKERDNAAIREKQQKKEAEAAAGAGGGGASK